ncbi:MAG: oxidative damage protection protein [Gammaproteobacteria bacterium]|nr:oxidative damage protection protein [Gammaproteobacteria bacterium]
MRIVQCRVLQREAQGLDRPPYPGELGMRIYEEISREAWMRWLEELSVLMNDHQLSSADPGALEDIENLMRAHFFGGEPVPLRTKGKK